MTSSAARRCRASTRNPLCRLGEGLAADRRDRPGRLPPHCRSARRFRAIADAMGVVEDRRHGRPRPCGGRGMARRSPRRSPPKSGLQGPHPQRRRGGALRHARRHLRLLPAGRDGRRHGRRQPRSRRSARRSGRRALGQPAARRLAGRGDARRGRQRPSDAIDEMLQKNLPPALGRPIFYRGRRRLARLRQGAHGGDRRAGQGRARLYARRRGSARFAKSLPRLRRRSSWRRRACRSGGRAPCPPPRSCSTAC